MPRMSKKRKQDWALFLNERNRITYNELCRKCSNDCKQSFRCIVVLCPKYLSKRRTINTVLIRKLKLSVREIRQKVSAIRKN